MYIFQKGTAEWSTLSHDLVMVFVVSVNNARDFTFLPFVFLALCKTLQKLDDFLFGLSKLGDFKELFKSGDRVIELFLKVRKMLIDLFGDLVSNGGDKVTRILDQCSKKLSLELCLGMKR